MNQPASDAPEARHRVCWYSRRTTSLPDDVGCHTIEDGYLLYCAHPMWWPIVGYQFDIKNCASCDFFKPTSPALKSWS